MIPDFVRQDLDRLSISISDDELTQLSRYLDLLLDANERFNLTGIRERDAAWRRHVVDSLTLLPWLAELTEGAMLVDVGSGGGLPGVVLAITQPHVKVRCVEATGKKAHFIESVAKELGLANLKVTQERAENLGQDSNHRNKYDVATCRALGPMRELLEYTLPMVKLGGCLLAMKGPSVKEELAAASDAMEILGGGEVQVADAYPEGSELNTVIVRVEKERPTPRQYPRKPGVPRQSPL